MSRALFAFPAAGGAGVSITPLAFNTIDLTTGYTKLEPDGMGYSDVSIAGGVNTITFNALGTGDLKYAFSGSGSEWPRHYADLNDADGTRLTTDDSFLMVVKLSNFTYPSAADFRMAVGCCVDPTSTTTAAFDGYGIGRRMGNVTTAREGHQVQLDTTNGNTNGFTYDGSDTIYGVVVRTAAQHAGNSVFGEVSGVNGPNAQYTQKSSQSLTASQDWSLFVAVATTSTGTISAGESIAFKAEYQIIKLR
jgi:hypothetical protein